MADTLPQNIPIPAENSIVSYDAIDYITNSSFATYYLGDSEIGTTTTTSPHYFLTKSPILSNKGAVEKGAGQSFDSDFDLEFNKKVTLKGKAFVNLFVYISTSASVNFDVDFYVKLFHVNSIGTETQLGNTIVRNLTKTISSTTYELVINAEIDVGEQGFKPDEKLRLNFTQNGSDPIPSNTIVQLLCDPGNRTDLPDFSGTYTLSNSRILVPLRVEL